MQERFEIYEISASWRSFGVKGAILEGKYQANTPSGVISNNIRMCTRSLEICGRPGSTKGLRAPGMLT